MRAIIRWLEWSVRALVTAVSPVFTEVVTSSGLNPARGAAGRKRITILGLVYTLGIGLIGINAGKGMNFDLFYLLGCAVVGWAAGARAAMLITLASAAFLYHEALQFRGGTSTNWIVYWNFLMRSLGLAATGRLAAEIGRLMTNLERTVHERTRRLQSEVAEHKETEVRLRETLELFKQVTENITEVFWVTDPAKSRVNYVSRGFETVWGQPRQAAYISPQVWLDAVHPEDRQRIEHATFTKQISGEYDEEYRLVRPDGSVCWVHDRAFPVRNEQNEVYRIVGITEDITERKRAEQLLQAQRDVGLTLGMTSELSAALKQLLATATRLEGIDCGGVYLVDEATGGLNLEAHRGLSPRFLEHVAQYGAEAPETALVEEGRMLYPICGPSWNTEGGFWSSEGLRALAVIPLKHEGEILGALTLGSHRQDEITPGIRAVIETIAAQAAGAIARIRLERQILEISDREQARIGQDIHDGLCQQLIGMAFNANSLEHALSAAQRPEAAAARKICALLDEAITESRRVCRGLYPVRLKTEGLVPALEELAHTTRERFQLLCDCEADRRRLHCDVTTATHLYRIAQEAVNNAIKHSGCRSVAIRLCRREGDIELEIKDDGKGIRQAVQRAGGMGLHIMDYRARSIGGSLRIRGDTSGTLVSCRVPQRSGIVLMQASA